MARMQGNTVDYSNYFFIDWQTNWQSTPGNYSNISWWAYWHFQNNDRQLDNGYANLGDVNRWSNGGRIYNYAGNFTTRDLLLASGSFDIGHNSDGTKTLNVAGGVTGYSGQRSEGSGSWALPTIPRYATITGHSGTITDEATSVYISYSNPYGGSVQADLYVRPYGSSGGFTNFATRAGYTSGANIALTTGERNAIRAALGSTNQGQLLYRVTNGVGNTDVGWGNEVQLNIINANPTFDASNISYQDTNSTVVAITTNNQKIVQNLSTLQGAFTAATALKSATITNYKVTLGTDIRNFSTAQAAIAYGAQNISVDTPLTIEVTDSRGNKTTASKTVTFLPWSTPRAVLTIGRLNNYEDSTDLKADVTIDSVDSKNAILSIQLKYKKTSDPTFTTTTMTSGVVKNLTLDKLFEWDIQIIITDKFGSTTYNTTVQKGIPIMFIDNGMLNIGIGKFPVSGRLLDIGGDVWATNLRAATALYANGSRAQTLADNREGLKTVGSKSPTCAVTWQVYEFWASTDRITLSLKAGEEVFIQFGAAHIGGTDTTERDINLMVNGTEVIAAIMIGANSNSNMGWKHTAATDSTLTLSLGISTNLTGVAIPIYTSYIHYTIKPAS